MRLSEAIRLGSLLLKPVAGQLFTGDDSGCAFGMACKAVGAKLQRPSSRKLDEIHILFPWTQRQLDTSEHACKVMAYCTVSQGITHLFDIHVMQAGGEVYGQMCDEKMWTLEQLVDWVDSLEAKDQVSTQRAVRDEELYGQVTRSCLVSSGHSSQTKRV